MRMQSTSMLLISCAVLLFPVWAQAFAGEEASAGASTTPAVPSAVINNPELLQMEARQEWAKARKSEPVPIFLARDEVPTKPDWTDWARAHGGVMFIPGIGAKPFWMLEVLTGGLKHDVIIAGPDGKYDMREAPIEMTLTRPIRVKHWGEFAGPVAQSPIKDKRWSEPL